MPTKVCLVKAMVFPVVMYGCESWTVKKAEHRRINAFELWCWRRLLIVPWTERRSNQSILKEISPGCSLEGLMLKLKFQYFGHLMWRVGLLEKTLMLGGIGGRRRRGRQRMRWLDGITDSMDVSLSQTPGVGDGQGGLACCDSWGREESDMTEWLNWTELKVENTNLTFLWILGVFSPYFLSFLSCFLSVDFFFGRPQGQGYCLLQQSQHSIWTMAQKNNFLKIEVQLIYSVTLVSGVQHSDLIVL